MDPDVIYKTAFYIQSVAWIMKLIHVKPILKIAHRAESSYSVIR